MFNQRETATILAALRLIQNTPEVLPGTIDDEGALSVSDIDRLAERINMAEEGNPSRLPSEMFTSRELNTLILALQAFREHPDHEMPHFSDVRPLDEAEIDALVSALDAPAPQSLPKTLSCKFFSAWEEHVLRTDAKVDLETGEVFDIDQVEIEGDFGPLVSEGIEVEFVDGRVLDYAIDKEAWEENRVCLDEHERMRLRLHLTADRIRNGDRLLTTEYDWRRDPQVLADLVTGLERDAELLNIDPRELAARTRNGALGNLMLAAEWVYGDAADREETIHPEDGTLLPDWEALSNAIDEVRGVDAPENEESENDGPRP